MKGYSSRELVKSINRLVFTSIFKKSDEVGVNCDFRQLSFSLKHKALDTKIVVGLIRSRINLQNLSGLSHLSTVSR